MKRLSYSEVGCRWVDANDGLPVEGSEVQVALTSASAYHGKYPNAYLYGDTWKYTNDRNILFGVTHWRYIENPYGSGTNGVAMEPAYRRCQEQDDTIIKGDLGCLHKQKMTLEAQQHIESVHICSSNALYGCNAVSLMQYLDAHRPNGKMCLSNGECEQIERAFKEDDWGTIIKYIKKYGSE